MTSFKIYSEDLSERSKRLIHQLLSESSWLKEILEGAPSYDAFIKALRNRAESVLSDDGVGYYRGDASGQEALDRLTWKEVAAIRILDYLDHSGKAFTDQNLHGKTIISAPFRLLWQAVRKGEAQAGDDFFEDMLHLFRQFSGRSEREIPSRDRVLEWMDRHPSGLDPEVMKQQEQNKERILQVILDEMERGLIQSKRYAFTEGMDRSQKLEQLKEWWNDHRFHLRFAIRSPERLNRMMGYQLPEEVMDTLRKGKEAGIPTFVNPYYLSLLMPPGEREGMPSDQAIRDYIFISPSLVKEFGHIQAWEMEDAVEPGKPNAAGWILPTRHNLHRRYPEVAILIPDTMGRACGGLCVSCQRMYDFQNGHLNFNLEKLEPTERWPDRLHRLMDYFAEDTQLRDILITGGDALMSRDRSLTTILEAVYRMALKKKEANASRPDGEKYAGMLRVRLGTRLPVYLPQRVTPSLVQVLSRFREKASRIGIRQFVIQTHFESAMEITPEVRHAVAMLASAGWTVTNQQVFISGASARGHAARLREVLNDIGVLTYYTFTVKGYKENHHSFVPNARVAQEQTEEKFLGRVPERYHAQIRELPHQAAQMQALIGELREKAGIPFLATDRSVMNLPGVGKSLTFRVIGITRLGRRILSFDHDHTRRHSPIIHEMGKVTIIESKSIAAYLRQLEAMGEDPSEYVSVYGYSAGETEQRMPIYEYPPYPYQLTARFSNLSI